MAFKDSLHPDSVAVGASVSGADSLLDRIAELACANPLASGLKPKKVARLLKDREKLGSTGLGDGLAIPHCSVDGIDDFVVGVLLPTGPVEFDSVDGRPADIFLFIVGPKDQRNRHINLLSAIAKMAQSGGMDDLRMSGSAAEARQYLLDHLSMDEETETTEKVMFQIYVQNMEYFDDILSLLSSKVSGSISVVETKNAGAYMFRMPLFAAFWTDKEEQTGRIIIAVADKPNANNLIRQIQAITGDPSQQSGILVTVMDLSYSSGSLDF